LADKIQTLLVSLEARINQYESTMRKAMQQTDRSARSIENRFKRMNTNIAANFGGLQAQIAAAFAGVAATRGAVQLIDSATRIENSLKVAGLAGEELDRVYGRLYDSAQKNAAPLETLAQLYGRVVLVQNELGTSTEEMLRFTDNVAMALRVAGTDAQSASGALLQLSQAMGSGVVRAEEFNSILEGALPIAQAAAAGLEEAGGSVAKLRQLVVDGKVSSEAFFRAFEAGAYTLENKVAGAELTVSQQFARLQNTLIDVAREMNEGTGASKLLGDGIANLADIVTEVGAAIQAAVGPVQHLVGLFQSGTQAAQNFANEIARLTGDGAGFGMDVNKWINDRQIPGLSGRSAYGDRFVTQTFELLGATPADEALAAALTGKAQPEPLKIVVESDKPAPVSLADFKPPTSSKSGGKTAGERYGDSVADMQQRITALNQETELMRTLNPLLNDYGYAKEKLKATQELENAARKAGIALGPEQRAQIEQLSAAYATASAESEKLAEAQNASVRQFEEMRDAARSALETIIDGFIEGKDAGEIFADVLKNIGSQLLQMGMNSLFGGGSTAGSGLFGKLFGFADGGYTGNGGKNEPAGVVHKGEYVFSKARTAQLGVANLERLHRGYANGGYVGTPGPVSGRAANDNGASFTFAPVVDARGADVAAVARLEQVLAKQSAEFEGRVKQVVRGKGTKWR
jgi:tape measure domain-containing protein